MLVMQIIALRHAAAEPERRSRDGTNTEQMAARLARSTKSLLRTVGQAERLLKQQQAGRTGSPQTPRRHPSPAANIRPPALQAAQPEINPMNRETPQPGQPSTPPPAPPRDALRETSRPAQAAPPKFTLCGLRTDLVKLATIPPAGTA